MFVLEFDGDIKASAADSLRHEISAILTQASESDEVLVKLESGGGMVHSYGLAASQLQRIRDKGIPLTIAVDKVAASGGYMMACVGNKILAAPFSIIGSIGVLAQIPNLNRLLKKHDIDFEQLSAGEYKRTLTLFGENRQPNTEGSAFRTCFGHFDIAFVFMNNAACVQQLEFKLKSALKFNVCYFYLDININYLVLIRIISFIMFCKCMTFRCYITV